MLDEIYLTKIRLKQPKKRRTAARIEAEQTKPEKEANNTEGFMMYFCAQLKVQLNGRANESGVS